MRIATLYRLQIARVGVFKGSRQVEMGWVIVKWDLIGHFLPWSVNDAVCVFCNGLIL